MGSTLGSQGATKKIEFQDLSPGEEEPDYPASMILKRIRVLFCSGNSPQDISTKASLSFPLILTDNTPPW